MTSRNQSFVIAALLSFIGAGPALGGEIGKVDAADVSSPLEPAVMMTAGDLKMPSSLGLPELVAPHNLVDGVAFIEAARSITENSRLKGASLVAVHAGDNRLALIEVPQDLSRRVAKKDAPLKGALISLSKDGKGTPITKSLDVDRAVGMKIGRAVRDGKFALARRIANKLFDGTGFPARGEVAAEQSQPVAPPAMRNGWNYNDRAALLARAAAVRGSFEAFSKEGNDVYAWLRAVIEKRGKPELRPEMEKMMQRKKSHQLERLLQWMADPYIMKIDDLDSRLLAAYASQVKTNGSPELFPSAIMSDGRLTPWGILPGALYSSELETLLSGEESRLASMARVKFLHLDDDPRG